MLACMPEGAHMIHRIIWRNFVTRFNQIKS
jgi:hypothetical protein